MKLVWEDVYSIFDDASLWENGHDMYWYRLMWGLMEYKNMNVYSTEADKVKVVSRAFAIIKIYREFINRCFDDEDIAESFDSASDDNSAVIGSANFDYRSFYLLFENSVILYNCSAVEQIKNDFENTFRESREITADFFSEISYFDKFFGKILKLFSCIM